jgi:hypothetical protein
MLHFHQGPASESQALFVPFLLCRLSSPRRRLFSILFSRAAKGGLVRILGWGLVAALRISATSRFKASRRFCPWARNRRASMTRTFPRVIRLPAMLARRFRTSAGSEERAGSNRSCTAVDTLLTFCPPGPAERMKAKRISSSSIMISLVMGIMPINYAVLSHFSSSTCHSRTFSPFW